MEISNESWHLRLVRFYNKGYMPVNLCGYFWLVMLSLAAFIPTVVAIGIGKFLGLLGIGIGQRIVRPINAFGTANSFWLNYVAIGLWVLITIYVVGGGLSLVGYGLYKAINASPFWTGIAFLCALGLAATVTALVFGIGTVVEYEGSLPKKEPTHKAPKPHKPKEPSLFWAFLRARKGKVCPMIRVREENPWLNSAD